MSEPVGTRKCTHTEKRMRILVTGEAGFIGSHLCERLLAAKLQIPVVVPIWDQGTIPEPADHFVGFIGAAYGGPRLLPEADVLLLVGARIDYRTGFGQPPGLDPKDHAALTAFMKETLYRVSDVIAEKWLGVATGGSCTTAELDIDDPDARARPGSMRDLRDQT